MSFASTIRPTRSRKATHHTFTRHSPPHRKRRNPLSAFDRLEDRTLLAGELDPTFGVGGFVHTNLGSSPYGEWADGIALQDDGKLVVAPRYTHNGNIMRVVRYTTSGALDPSFGTGGVAEITFATSSPYGALDVALDSQQRIVVVGHIGVARLLPDGRPDTTFDSDGKIDGGLGESSGLAIDSKDRPLISRKGPTVFRLLENGAPDLTFGNGGSQTIPTAQGPNTKDIGPVRIDSLGRIIAAPIGGLAGYIYVSRLTENGQFDTTFNSSGSKTVYFGSNAIGTADSSGTVAIDSRDRIIVGGHFNWGGVPGGGDLLLTRINPDGSLDTTFDGDGKAVYDFGGRELTACTIVDQADNVLIGGYTYTSHHHNVLLVKVQENGQLDPDFGTGGKVTADFGVDSAYRDMVVDTNNRIVASGTTQNPQGDILLARYLNTPLSASLSIADATLTEGNTGTQTMEFTVSLPAPLTETATVHWTTVDGTAQAGTDYTTASGLLTFDPGLTSQTIHVSILGDTLSEPDETFTVKLSDPVNVTITDDTATGTILDDDHETPSLVVNTISDVINSSDSQNSLREALAFAASRLGADTVTFDPTLFGSVARTITLNPSYGEVLITDSGGVTIQGPGADLLTIQRASTAPEFRIVNISGGAVATLEGLTLRGGRRTDAAGHGGGIYNAGTLTLRSSAIVENTSSQGGGIKTSGTLTVEDSDISGNTVVGTNIETTGGGIFNTGALTITSSTINSNYGFFGGAIRNTSSGSVMVTTTTMRGNSSRDGGALSNLGLMTVTFSTISGNSSARAYGGGIDNDGTVTLVSCTISGNFGGTFRGGGIYTSRTMTIISSTISGNQGNGGIYNIGVLTLENSIVANSSGGPDLIGPITGSHNLIEDGTHGLPDTVTGDPKLGPLADNGGPTLTHALLKGSPAIDAGATLPSITTDQRGVARPQGFAYDIGAFELEFTGKPGSLVVTTADDIIDSTDYQTSLREALAFAASRPGADTVTFDTKVFGSVARTISLASTLEINDTGGVKVVGPGAELLSLSGHNSIRPIRTATGSVVELVGLTIRDGVASYNHTTNMPVIAGGGIVNNGDLTLRSVVVRDNVSRGSASGYYAYEGGGIYSASGASLTLIDSEVRNNLASCDAGSGRSNGGGISAAGMGGAIQPGGSVVIMNSRITDNTSQNVSNYGSAHSGGLQIFADLTLTDSVISGNRSYANGRYYYASAGGLGLGGGSATIERSVIRDNVVESNREGEGGGMDVRGPTEIRDSLITGNRVITASGNSYGGGVVVVDTQVVISNTTISGNSITNTSGTANGGGICSYTLGSSSLLVENSTITGNAAKLGGGVWGNHPVTLRNSIVANSIAGGDVSGPILGSHNLIEDGTGGLADTVTGDPMLGPLADNGGPTLTHALLEGSPAIDAGATLADVTTDQRGVIRPQGAAYDIGAFELEAPPVPEISIFISDATIAEGDSGTRNAVFTVSLSAASSETVTVTYSTADDTATATLDYAPKTLKVLTFLPGQTQKTISIAVKGDLFVESDEQFLVNLTDPVNATLDDAQGIGTITNDDIPIPTSIRVSDVTALEGQSGARQWVFTVTLSNPSNAPVSVHYITTDGTASMGSDYDPRVGVLTFPNGRTTKTVAVTVYGDRQIEPNERFFLDLSSPVYATIADSRGVGTITNDDFAALRLAGSVSKAGPAVETLSRRRLERAVDAALGLWQTAGITPAQTAALNRLRYVVADLPGNLLGLASLDTVVIDTNAAGQGWSTAKRPARRVDLTSVLAHEMGHALGYGHTRTGLMADRLKPGAKWAPWLLN